jgi:hypothetical protein
MNFCSSGFSSNNATTESLPPLTNVSFSNLNINTTFTDFTSTASIPVVKKPASNVYISNLVVMLSLRNFGQNIPESDLNDTKITVIFVLLYLKFNSNLNFNLKKALDLIKNISSANYVSGNWRKEYFFFN